MLRRWCGVITWCSEALRTHGIISRVRNSRRGDRRLLLRLVGMSIRTCSPVPACREISARNTLCYLGRRQATRIASRVVVVFLMFTRLRQRRRSHGHIIRDGAFRNGMAICDARVVPEWNWGRRVVGGAVHGRRMTVVVLGHVWLSSFVLRHAQHFQDGRIGRELFSDNSVGVSGVRIRVCAINVSVSWNELQI